MSNTDLPLLLAGPILRRLQPQRLTFWLATSRVVECKLTLFPEGQDQQDIGAVDMANACRVIEAGKHLFFLLIDLPLDQALPVNTWVGYELALKPLGDETWQPISEWAKDLCYPGKQTPGFVLRTNLDNLLHGSCRKPHHDSGDGLVRADSYLSNNLETPEKWPTLLMLSGDQVYADDVAAPMLVAIHRLLDKLQLPHEVLEEADVVDTQTLCAEGALYYRREELLPKTRAGSELRELLFGGVRKPVFTSDNAHNHLISLGEVLAMYLLVWSPQGWKDIDLEAPQSLSSEYLAQYQQEREIIERFSSELGAVRRVMAHLPVAMMFDDHDITDDWNLTAGWEQTAYGHPFSRRIIGNALLGYMICQGWGNAPEQIPDSLLDLTQDVLKQPGSDVHEALLEQLFQFSQWHYHWDTNPILIVLDTRTHRWRSEKGLNQPSGLMDWEALTDLQHLLLGQKAVVMVSPAPIFGVKLIETIQRAFSWFGQPLLVDAENWMAHSGSAHTLMNLFRHPRTPQNFVILSGDVHYSFVYDIELRGHQRGPDIWQITSSGLRNEFPKRLLDIFDRLNRWLYAPWSPLNWFTKRRRMRVIPRKPDSANLGERLVNAAGIGLVELSPDGKPERVVQLCADGQDIEFQLHEPEARWE